MDAWSSDDDPMRALEALAFSDHAPDRARRIRDRAVGLLARRRRRAFLRARLVAAGARWAEGALAGALSLGFAAWTVTRSIEILHRARGGFFWP